MRKILLIPVLAVVLVMGLVSPAWAQIDPGYLNQPLYIPTRVGEWFTLNNQPMTWRVIRQPFGYYTGLCALFGVRADGMMTTSFTSTGALEGQVGFYAQDANGWCRGDIPITMPGWSAIDMDYTYAPGENLNDRHLLCSTGGVRTHSHYVFVRREDTGCRPPGAFGFDNGWYQIHTRLSYVFNGDWWGEAWFYTWPAASVNIGGCFDSIDDWGQCLHPDGRRY